MSKYIVIVVILFGSELFSQEQYKSGSPEWVTQQNYIALKTKNYEAICNYTPKDEMDKYKEAFIEAFKDDSINDLYKGIFPSVMDYDSFVNLPSIEIYKLWIKYFLNQDADVIKTMLNSNYKVLGHVQEGDSLAHVVVRVEMFSPYFGNESIVSVLTLKKEDNRWKPETQNDIKSSVFRAIDMLKYQYRSDHN